MLHIKFYPKNSYYYNQKGLVTSVSDHSSSYYSKIKVGSQETPGNISYTRKHLNVGSALFLGSYEVATWHNVKSMMKQRYAFQR